MNHYRIFINCNLQDLYPWTWILHSGLSHQNPGFTSSLWSVFSYKSSHFMVMKYLNSHIYIKYQCYNNCNDNFIKNLNRIIVPFVLAVCAWCCVFACVFFEVGHSFQGVLELLPHTPANSAVSFSTTPAKPQPDPAPTTAVHHSSW